MTAGWAEPRKMQKQALCCNYGRMQESVGLEGRVRAPKLVPRAHAMKLGGPDLRAQEAAARMYWSAFERGSARSRKV